MNTKRQHAASSAADGKVLTAARAAATASSLCFKESKMFSADELDADEKISVSVRGAAAAAAAIGFLNI